MGTGKRGSRRKGREGRVVRVEEKGKRALGGSMGFVMM